MANRKLEGSESPNEMRNIWAYVIKRLVIWENSSNYFIGSARYMLKQKGRSFAKDKREKAKAQMASRFT